MQRRLTTLFSKQKLEEVFVGKEQVLKERINRYSDDSILKIDIDSEAKKLVSELNFNVPKLKKESLDIKITKEKISGMQFPPGRSFTPGKIYEIEIANYSVQFSGDSEYLNYHPNTFRAREIMVELQRGDVITIPLTNYDTITGNDQAIEGLKNEFLSRYEIIEKYLEALRNEVEIFKPVLEEKIKNYLSTVKSKTEAKNDAKNKLNPFN